MDPSLGDTETAVGTPPHTGRQRWESLGSWAGLQPCYSKAALTQKVVCIFESSLLPQAAGRWKHILDQNSRPTHITELQHRHWRFWWWGRGQLKEGELTTHPYHPSQQIYPFLQVPLHSYKLTSNSTHSPYLMFTLINFSVYSSCYPGSPWDPLMLGDLILGPYRLSKSAEPRDLHVQDLLWLQWQVLLLYNVLLLEWNLRSIHQQPHPPISLKNPHSLKIWKNRVACNNEQKRWDREKEKQTGQIIFLLVSLLGYSAPSSHTLSLPVLPSFFSLPNPFSPCNTLISF